MELKLPTYIRVMKIIRGKIISGALEPNQKIESIKELSKKYNVNTNTVQRALVSLEKEGLIRSNRTEGKYVTDNKILISSIRYKEARKVTEEFITRLETLGINSEELVKLFAEPEFLKDMETA